MAFVMDCRVGGLFENVYCIHCTHKCIAQYKYKLVDHWCRRGGAWGREKRPADSVQYNYINTSQKRRVKKTNTIILTYLDLQRVGIFPQGKSLPLVPDSRQKVNQWYSFNQISWLSMFLPGQDSQVIGNQNWGKPKCFLVKRENHLQ